ncbi:N-acetylmuramoyl-L-alanine amidase [Streptomyces luteolus]|uniref:N-acetylmuramoyl-L-alanine amidase n=1 Tax=Streptomyces luteolus TaxID=3043615 RepID=A0ABT6SWH0_9ACTN|nr:N-acetylmuramoyl-L-alanine amidase [Streptomyces sp. B-S-A12]MDI3419936.1 N-acetylmuramoyl-L-alanine amidase [Streptomyces sp. B-S-A12]
MSYDDPDNPSPAFATAAHRPRRRVGLVAVSALVPVGLVGFLLWQSGGGSGGSGSEGAAPGASDGSGKNPAPSAQPERSASPSKSQPADTGELTGKTVVIDPGHNPNNRNRTADIARVVDIGTNKKECDTTGTATNDGYSEAEFTLDLARKVRTLLEKQGATVKFTQDGDRPFGPCVDERARIGNKADADAVISLHADGSGEGNRGFHVIMPGKVDAGAADTGEIVGPSRDLGERLAGSFVRATGSAPSNYIGDGTGLDTRTDLGGLNLSKVPKVFLECGNMRDPKDEALLTSAGWREKAAKGISAGVAEFLRA